MSAGRDIDRYRIERELGRGAFGAVYVARHTVLDALVALKVLLPERVQMDEFAVERFLREARAAAAIGNPHIIRVSDAGTTPDGHAFLAMELLEGEDLSSYLGRRGRLHPHDAIEIILQVLTGLTAAHDAGIVHRDMKPANVFITIDARDQLFAKILDFGVSKMHRPVATEPRLTATGVVIGTPHYMAPEQLVESSTVDARADLYSVGVILYELLTGQLPYRADTLGALIKAVMTSTPAPIHETAPDAGGAVQSFVLRALAREADQRFQSAREMAMVLRIARDAGGESSSDIPATFDGERRVLTRTAPMEADPRLPHPSAVSSLSSQGPPLRPSPAIVPVVAAIPANEARGLSSTGFAAVAVLVFLCPIAISVPAYLMSDRLRAAYDAFVSSDDDEARDDEARDDENHVAEVEDVPTGDPAAAFPEALEAPRATAARTTSEVPLYDGREALVDETGLTFSPGRARPGADGRWFVDLTVTVRAAGAGTLTYQRSDFSADGYAATSASDFPTIGMMAAGRSTSGTLVWHAIAASPNAPSSLIVRYHGWARRLPVSPGA